jgi:hypothetical protein
MRIFASFIFLLLGASALAAPIVTAGGGDGVTDDIFDVRQSTTVLGNSPLLGCCGGAPAENTFGGTGGVEGVHTLFSDGLAVGSIDFINFRTANPIELTGYNALLADDSDNPMNPGDPNRGSSSFSLFTSPDDTFTSVTLVSTTQLPFSYSSNFGTNAILISDTFAPVQAQFFRLEVTRATSGGPRIRELDGVGRIVPEPGSGGLLVLGVLGLLARRR